MALSETLSEARYLMNSEGQRTDVLLSWELWVWVLQLLQVLMERVGQSDDAGFVGDYLKSSAASKQELLDDVESNSWVKFAGLFKDDPMFDEFVEAIAQNRRDVDLLISRGAVEEQ